MKSQMCTGLAAAAVALTLGFGNAAWAQTSTGSGTSSMSSAGTSSSTQASTMDKMFLKKATQGSNFEIKTAQLALQKSNNDQVKQFAQMMIEDHTKLNDQMKPVAAEAGVEPPTGISAKEQMVYDKLSALNGTAFDKAYAQTMVTDHKQDSKEFKTEATSGQLASEKSAASAGLQVVDMHLQKAEQLQKSMQAS